MATKLELPCAPEYEKTLLNILINDASTFYKISSLVSPKDFYSVLRAEIFTVCGKFISKGRPIDPIVIMESFSTESELVIDQKALENELNAILEMSHGVETSIEFYAAEVKKQAIKRRLYYAGEQIVQKYLEKDTDYENITAELYSKLSSIASVKGQNQLLEVKKFISEYMDVLVTRSKIGINGVIGLKSGFVDIDILTTGFKDVSLIILAGRTSHGKSTLMQNIIENIAYDERKTSLLFSLECSREEILDKFLASRANIDSRKIRIGSFNNKDWERVNSAMGDMYNNLNVLIDDEPVRTMDDIQIISHLAKQKFGISLIAIDYLQLIKPDYRKGASRAELIGEISRRGKIISKELKVPVILLSQLSREIEKRQDHRPLLSDLKDSGEIEANADLVLFIHREELYKAEPDNANLADLYLAKQRGGPIGQCKLRFQKEVSRFITRFSAADIPMPEEDNYERAPF